MLFCLKLIIIISLTEIIILFLFYRYLYVIIKLDKNNLEMDIKMYLLSVCVLSIHSVTAASIQELDLEGNMITYW